MSYPHSELAVAAAETRRGEAGVAQVRIGAIQRSALAERVDVSRCVLSGVVGVAQARSFLLMKVAVTVCLPNGTVSATMVSRESIMAMPLLVA